MDYFVEERPQAQMCFCGFYKMFKNTLFKEHLRVIASANDLSVQKVINYLFFVTFIWPY